MSARVLVAIAHAAWDDKRKPTLFRLGEQLGRDAGARVFESDKPEHSWVWARRIWQWAAEMTDGVGGDAPEADAVAILNDDVEVCPRFVDVVAAMVEAVPGEVLSLHAQGPDPARLLAEGHNWARAYNLTGPAYVFQRGHARALLDYWESTPDLQNVKDCNEDNVAAQWAYSIQRPMWLSLPAPVKHDAGVPSTMGYDHHTLRVTSVPWDAKGGPEPDMTDPRWWRVDTPNLVPWMPNPWFSNQDLERQRRKRRFPTDIGDACFICEARMPYVTNAKGRGVCVQCLAEMNTQALRSIPMQRGQP